MPKGSVVCAQALSSVKFSKGILQLTLALLLLLLCGVSPVAFAQQDTAPKGEDQKPDETIKVNVNVVQLFFNVKDKHGVLIPNLNKNDSIFSRTANRKLLSISMPKPICRSRWAFSSTPAAASAT